MLKPYLPNTSLKVEDFINKNNNEWKYERLDKAKISNNLTTLFERYDKKLIEEEKTIILDSRK